MLKKAYLLSYNVCQLAGWSYVGLLLWPHLVYFLKSSGQGSSAVYRDCSDILRLFQVGAYLEVVHNLTGLVKGNPVITASQITSRCVIACIVTDNFLAARESAAYVTMLFAWTLTEMVRYTFYALSVIDIKLALVTWLRYTLFIVLYPLGAGSELVTMYSAMPDIKKSSILTLAMPNQFNATFSLYYALIIFALMYPPAFPQLYLHMFSQRRKALGGIEKPKTQ